MACMRVLRALIAVTTVLTWASMSWAQGRQEQRSPSCAASVDPDVARHPALRDGAAPRLLLRIPAMALSQALERFHMETRQPILYDGSLARGKRSSALNGWYRPDDALRCLLQGTGLREQRGETGVWALAPDRQAETAGGRPGSGNVPSGRADVAGIYGQVQARVRSLLCRHAETRPGAYRLAVRLWVGRDNRVERVALHPTGDVRRDAVLRDGLAGLHFGAVPASGIPQPLALLVLAGDQGDSECPMSH